MGIIFYLSSIPGRNLPPLPYETDKIVHLIIYTILGFFLAGGFQEKDLFAIIIGMLYGISDEIHQSFIPLRTCSFYDWLADAAGIILGVLIFSMWRKKDGTGRKR